LQVGNKPAFNAFLAQHPDGFYASLAKLQLEKLAAEEAHAAATAKAKEAEAQRARLAAEGAQNDAQARAEANAKAAEQAQLAADKAKQVAQDQAAEAERKRAEAAATAPAVAAPAAPEKVAALGPPPSQPDLTKSVQTELRRVGCLTGDANGDWNTTSQRSLSAFNRNAGTRLDVKTVSADTLDAIKQKQSRVCPLTCGHGYKVDGDQCVKIVCAEGSFLNDDNECEKRRGKTPVTKRDRPEPRQVPEARQAPAEKQAVVGRSRSRDPSVGANGRPLTGLERAQGCNGYQSIMSGVCP
jgi:hypothetical protein